MTSRGAKHLHELVRLAEEGFGAVLFCVQRSDAQRCSLVDHIDPVSGLRRNSGFLGEATTKGVLFFAYQAELSPQAITIKQKMPFFID